MKNKKKLAAGAVALSAVLIAAGTFAWFTTTDKVENTFQMDNFDVSITEDFDTPDVPLTPGADVTKEVGITNSGNVDVLVRVKLEETLKLLEMDEEKENNALKVEYTSQEQTSDPYVPVLISDEMIQAYEEKYTTDYSATAQEKGVPATITVLRKETTNGDNTVYSYVAYVTATNQLVKVTPNGDNAETPDSFDVEYAYNKRKDAGGSKYEVTASHGKEGDDGDSALATYYGSDFHTDAVTLNFDDKVSTNGTLNSDTTWFLADDGYFYYTKALNGSSISDPLLKSVKINENAGNALKGATYTITPEMEAVQVEHDAVKATWNDLSYNNSDETPQGEVSGNDSTAINQMIANIINFGEGYFQAG